MEILVTGGAGFIGGHLAERFVADGHDVTVLDNLDPFYATGIKERTVELCRDRAADASGSYTLVEGDVRDADTVQSVVPTEGYIFHQAAQAGVRQSVDDPRRYHEINVDGTLNLLDAARERDVRRFVCASSSSVYGEMDSLPVSESDPTTPKSPYGASKLAAERYACAYDSVYDLPAVALRYFTVYGPRMRPNMAISNFVSRCLNGDPPVIYGDGTQTRDFTFIEDIVDANVQLLDTDAADGEAINVGSTDTIEIRTLARQIRDRLAPDLDIVFEARHEADTDHTHADTSKATDVLDYEPDYTIDEGVDAFIQWYRANREWYEPLVRSS
jgi:UDP-glucose 4-epimerase